MTADSTKKILLCIDDEAVGLKIRKLILERSGYDVLTAEDGISGLEVFRNNKIDAVVIDYYMPRMDGGRVAEQMKTMHPEVPIVLLSAYVSLPEHSLAHVDAFITKGDSPEILLSKIKELILK